MKIPYIFPVYTSYACKSTFDKKLKLFFAFKLFEGITKPPSYGGSLAPPVGFEPTTTRLTAEGSTTELRRTIYLYLFRIFPFSIYEKCWHLPIFPDRLQSSIFGTIELNFRVRYGNGWTLNVINTNFSSSLFLSYHIYSFLSILFLHLFSLVTRTGIEPVFPA